MKLQTIILLAVSVLVALPAQTAPQSARSSANPAKPRIGVYDSRAVAVAYCGTPVHEAKIKRLDDALKQAKASGDEKAIKECDAAVWEARKQLHRQGFSTFPVDDILEHVTNEVATIKNQERLEAIVSKWDKAALAKYPKAEQVDVTPLLVDAFHPKERQRKNALDIQKHKPVPTNKIEKVIEQEMKGHGR